VRVLGSEDTPAIPLNKVLEATYLPNAEKVRVALRALLSY
jgi:2-oxoisovalerate dehydrogenase E1 component